jgi:DNA polymerase-3 subunit gamma/tau
MSDFIVSARKYRPDSFNTVVGQKSTTATLLNAIRAGHLAQAYLFCGPRGVGKTTCARIFAKTINCIHLNEKTEACNECESCKSFNQNRSFNIHELDAASNNSVDDIRNLIDQVRVPPQVSRYSVYIIDEVHMLSQSAFNAFLKTLEEPPKHAVFILATTEKHKIIPTILSRCQIFDFNRIRIKDIVEYLEFISQQENVEFEQDALNIIAQKAEGSMRDALSIYDQTVSFSENKVTYQKVIENLNILDYEYYFNLTDHFINEEVSDALLLFDEILAKGFDAHNFISGLSNHFRDLLVSKAEKTLQLLEVGENIKDKYKEQALRCSNNLLFNFLDICSACDLAYKSSINPRLHVELTLIRLCNQSDEKKKEYNIDNVLVLPGVSESKALKKTETLTTKAPLISKKTDQPSSETTTVTPKIRNENTPSIKDALNVIGKSQAFFESQENQPYTAIDENNSTCRKKEKVFTPDELQNLWKEFVEKLSENEPRMYAVMKNQEPSLRDGYQVEVVFRNNTQISDFRTKIKPSLLSFLQKELENTTIEVIEIIDVKDQVKQAIHFSDNDKLKLLIEKNPALQKLRQEFNLDFD